MNQDITRIIEQYLSGELSQEDQIIFEDRLEKSTALQQEVALQKSIHAAAKRSAVRNEVQQVAQRYHFKTKMKWGGLGLGVLVLAISSSLFITNSMKSSEAFELDSVKELVEKLNDQGVIDNLKSEFFAWNSNDTAFLSTEGVLVSVPANAFLLNGKPYSDPAVIQWQEALDGATIVKSGLSTVSDGRLLETQGMFSFSAKTPEGKQLTINPKVGVYVQVPVDEYKEGMKLFDGEKDANGIINWVKPRELEKIPIPIDMSKLDFYPPEYEAKLNEMKARKDKKYRDSLYLSFESLDFYEKESYQAQNSSGETEAIYSGNWRDNIKWSFYVEYIKNGEANIVGKAILKKGWKIFSVDHDPSKADFVGNPTEFKLPMVQNVQKSDQLRNGKPPKVMNSELGTWIVFENEALFKQRVKVNSTVPFPFTFNYSFQICNNVGCIFPPEQTATVWFNVNQEQELDAATYIPPSSVLAFWKPKFNKTILSTREFEARMKEIHRTCDKSLLETYVRNLNKPMYELDEMAIRKGYAQFARFADQRVGSLNPNSPHLKGLGAFYDQAVEQLKYRERTLRNKEGEKRNDWDNEVVKARAAERSRTNNRDAQVFIEEYNLNHKNVRKQLGLVLGATIYGDSPISNIDRFVMETTLARKTAEYLDPVTGKTARIQYNEFSFDIANYGNYEKLFAYIFPNQLNSYHRLTGTNGKFSFPLNDAITYDLAIVGISEKGYSYVQRLTVKGGDLGTLNLKKVSETMVDASIRNLNAKRGIEAFDVKEELRWLQKEQKNYVEQKRRSDEVRFRNELRPKVFPCDCEANYSDTLQ